MYQLRMTSSSSYYISRKLQTPPGYRNQARPDRNILTSSLIIGREVLDNVSWGKTFVTLPAYQMSVQLIMNAG